MQVKERPILFSGPMVRAILEGKKTQTRRIIKPQPCPDDGPIKVDWFHPTMVDKWGNEDAGPEVFGAFSECGEWGAKCPYGAPGDRLWVRESIDGTLGCDSYYLADETRVVDAIGWFDLNLPVRKIPSIHMPRRVSRITLEITEVRVERLQEISEVDAINEGILSVRSPEWDRQHFPAWRSEFDSACAANRKPPVGPSPARTYQALWESINGKGSWESNPWVWVIEFARGEVK
jgi:hypothetical protein